MATNGSFHWENTLPRLTLELREGLLGLLWPDVPEETARNNLRVVLAGLRRALGAVADAALLADRQYVRLAPANDHTLDVARFRSLLAALRGLALAAERPAASRSHLSLPWRAPRCG